MKRLPRSCVVTRNDRLVKRWWDTEAKREYIMPKRVAASCQLTKEERHLYAYKRPIACVKAIVERTGMTITEAWNLVKQERGDTVFYGQKHN